MVLRGEFDAKLPPINRPDLYVIPEKLLFDSPRDACRYRLCPLIHDLVRSAAEDEPVAEIGSYAYNQKLMLASVGFNPRGMPLEMNSREYACWRPVLRDKGSDSTWPTLSELLNDSRVLDWWSDHDGTQHAFDIHIVNVWGDLYRLGIDPGHHQEYAVHAHVINVSSRRDDQPIRKAASK
jgi:hypothetical protein